MKKAMLYSGGYESTILSMMYPKIDKLFIQNTDTPTFLVREMKKRGCIVYKTGLPHRWIILQGILVAKQLGYKVLYIGIEKDDKSTKYFDNIEFVEQTTEFLKQLKGIRIIPCLRTAKHSEIIKTVLNYVKKEDVFTCDFMKKGKTRCGKCLNCKIEEKVLKS